VPTGAELVLDLDVQQLRLWDATERLLALLPPAATARLALIGPHWLNEIDGLVVAAWRGPHGDESLALLRGDLDDEKLPALLDGEGERSELYGRALYTAGSQAILRLAPRVVALGSAVEVRRVADVVRGDLQGVREAKADKALREALARAPSAKTGRPALLGGAIGGPLLNERLDAIGGGGRKPAWAAIAIAVGDGVDVVLSLGLPTPADAVALRLELDRALRDLRARPLVRLLGLGDLFDIASRARERELRLAYRISGAQLDGFFLRMDKGRRALEAMKPAPAAPPSAAPPPAAP